MDIDQQVELKLNGGGFQFEGQVTLMQAGQIVAFIGSGHMPQVAPVPSGNPSAPAIQELNSTNEQTYATPRDALIKSGAKTNMQKLVAFAAYVTSASGNDTFSLDELSGLFKRTGEKSPKNLHRDFKEVVKADFADVSSDGDGTYYLTNKAYDALVDGFQDEPKKAKASSKTRPTARSARRSVKIPSGFEDMVIETTLPGYPKYHGVKKKSDKFLWALIYGKGKGHEDLSGAELSFLTDKLGAGIASGDINGYFKRHHARGYVNKTLSSGRIRILPDGEAYIKSLGKE